MLFWEATISRCPLNASLAGSELQPEQTETHMLRFRDIDMISYFTSKLDNCNYESAKLYFYFHFHQVQKTPN